MKRSEMLNIYEDVLEALSDSENVDVLIPKKKELSKDEIMDDEYELLGYYVTAHPLDDYKIRLNELTRIDQLEIDNLADDFSSINSIGSLKNKTVHLGGLIVEYKMIKTKKGQEMAFLTLDDQTGTIEVVVFPFIYKKIKEKLGIKKILEIKGKVEYSEREINGEIISIPKILLADCIEMQKKQEYDEVLLTVNNSSNLLEIKNLISNNPGLTDITFIYSDFILKTNLKLKQSIELFNQLQNLCMLEGKNKK